MQKKVVIDSGVILTLFERQPGWEEVVDLLHDSLRADERLLMTHYQWGEMIRAVNQAYADYERAERVLRVISRLPIRFAPINRKMEKRAADLFRTARLTHVASYVAALAIELKAELATGDAEFRRIDNEVKIRWIAVSNTA